MCRSAGTPSGGWLEPKLPAAYVMVAQSYEEAKVYEKAIHRYRRYLTLSRNDEVKALQGKLGKARLRHGAGATE